MGESQRGQRHFRVVVFCFVLLVLTSGRTKKQKLTLTANPQRGGWHDVRWVGKGNVAITLHHRELYLPDSNEHLCGTHAVFLAGKWKSALTLDDGKQLP